VITEIMLEAEEAETTVSFKRIGKADVVAIEIIEINSPSCSSYSGSSSARIVVTLDELQKAISKL